MGNQHMWQQAYAHAGIAVEMALKCWIMRRERMNCWPSRSERRELYSHDINALIAVGGLEAAILQEVADGTDLGRAWLTVKDWTVEARYLPGRFPYRVGRDMMEAVVKTELVAWLTKP